MSVQSRTTLRHYTSELLGTCILVMVGTSAIVINEQTSGSVGHIGVSLTFGLIVAALIYTLGPISGSHMNPAVSIALAVRGELPLRALPGYIISQCAGAVLGSLIVSLLFPSNISLGATRPSGPVTQTFWLEVILTFILVLVILGMARGPREHRPLLGLVVGGVVGLEALFAGPITGASMNPARSLGPAIVSGNISHLWVYLVAPCLGASAAAGVHALLERPQPEPNQTPHPPRE
jgi:aquaporin NIP